MYGIEEEHRLPRVVEEPAPAVKKAGAWRGFRVWGLEISPCYRKPLVGNGALENRYYPTGLYDVVCSDGYRDAAPHPQLSTRANFFPEREKE